MSNSVLRRLRLLVLLQKIYLMYTCQNTAKKPNLDELLPTKLFVQYRIENCGKKKYVWQLTGFYPLILCLLIFLFSFTYFFSV